MLNSLPRSPSIHVGLSSAPCVIAGRVPRLLLLVIFLLTASCGVADERMQRLSPDKQAIAQQYTDFVTAMDEKYFGRVGEMNAGISEETLEISNEYSDYEILVTRGPVVEKFGRMLSEGKKTSPGRGDRVLTWGRFYSLDAHPRTPLVGMLHATIVLQFFENGDIGTGGWLGVMPGTRVDADLQALKALTDAHFARYDKSPDLYRELICKGTEDTIAYWRRKPACVGVSFYGPPVFRESGEKSFQFIAELYDDFVGLYLDQVAARDQDAYTPDDLMAQETMRRQWLLDQLFSDPFASKIVPFEAWGTANLPPEVKF